MTEREKDINTIVNIVRQDLKEETRKALRFSTNKEIKSILKESDVVKCLVIESVFIEMVLYNRIEESSIQGWDIENSLLYGEIREKHLTIIRNNKIDKLTDE